MENRKIKTLYDGIINGTLTIIWNGITDKNAKVTSGLYTIIINDGPLKVIFDGR